MSVSERVTGERPLDLSIVVPCYNEELNIPELTERVLRTLQVGQLRGELILVDDGSADATARVIREQMEAAPDRVVGVFHPKNRGMAGAWRSGVDAARGANVAIMDADLQYQPEDVLRLYRTLVDTSVDVVQGWRSSVGRLRDGRYKMSRGFNTILNGAFGMSLKDNKSGFVCCGKEVMQDLLTYAGHYAYWQAFIMVAAHCKGYSYREIETLFEERKQGRSFLDGQAYRAAALCLLDVGTALWEYRVKAEPHALSPHFLGKHGAELKNQPSPQAHPSRFRAYMATFDRTHSVITKNVERYYETLQSTQWLTPEAIRDLQDEKLRRLIRHAYRTVPYYRTKMQELKLRPEDIRTQNDLFKLPLLTKDDVRRSLHFDIMQQGVSPTEIHRLSTSGNSGEPLICYANKAQLEFRWAAALRCQEWTGFRFGDPSATLWQKILDSWQSQELVERLDARLSNRLLIPAFELNTSELGDVLRRISSKRPALIEGSAEVLCFLAEYAEAHAAFELRPKAVMTHGQTLRPQDRALIERVFGCDVFDQYRSRELSVIASESDAHDGHLVVAEGQIVELLVDGRPAEPGEIGEVVVTDLNNFCMPFIRYRIGDLATAVDDSEPSACGRGLPRIGELQGRAHSIIQGMDGRFVPGTFFDHVFGEYQYAVRRFRVVQEQPGAIELRLVKSSRYSDATLDEIEATIRRHLGSRLRIDRIFQPRIDAGRPGMGATSVSKLPIDFQKQAPSEPARTSVNMARRGRSARRP